METLGIFLGIYVAAMVIEILWSIYKKKDIYNWKDSLSNFAIILGGRLIKPLSLAWGAWLFSLVEPIRLFEIPINVFTVIITFLLSELVYYWYHRLSHEISFLWALHHTHHSSPWLNISTAGRLHWLGKFTSIIFYIPLVFIGFPPTIVIGSLAFSLFYQIFLHTQIVGKLPFLEGWLFNTPSAHRVHHASNERYVDKNYGGTLILFDRIFGTYVPEQEKAEYGVTTGFVGHNPIKVLITPIVRLFKGEKI
ncbi:sterol desaturase family protein [Fulvivirgaceae bacterium BMA12]|uniref:Sterol desaturase family protein n=1 Tax=Agaribacillus aureus TaxID=3051825 RepID=A0ABT8L7P7_9BACT|nr:sterol desaturase family protein [Fulvivirgaceae bacterium BMA12]